MEAKRVPKKLPEIRQTLTSKIRLLKADPLLQNKIIAELPDSNISHDLKTLAKYMDDSLLAKTSEFAVPASVPKMARKKPAAPRVELLPKPRTNLTISTPQPNDFRNGLASTSTGVKHGNKKTTGAKPTKAAKPILKTESCNKIGLKPALKTPKRRSVSADRVESTKESSLKSAVKTVSFHNSRRHEDSRAEVGSSRHVTNHFPRFSLQNTAKNLPQTKLADKTEAKVLKSALKTPLRRSVSAEKFDSAKHSVMFNETTFTPGRKTVSFQNLNSKTFSDDSFTTVQSHVSTSFYTPVSSEKKKTYRKTPAMQSHQSSRFSLQPPKNAEELTRNLRAWLQKRGKTLGEYSHLKCFDIFDEEKENIEEPILDGNSFEDDRNDNVPVICVNDAKPEPDTELMAKEVLLDIVRLIQEGYTVEMCESWLQLIKDKFGHVESEPNYWECRAAIEQSRGNINGAVECYQTAIVKGAEPKKVDESLDKLLQKFSLLNISVDEDKSKKRQKIVEDARNIFKSHIIQFALREKNKKNKNSDKEFVATPVRRSTRLSRSRYTATPDVKVFDSLKDIQSPFTFSSNRALLH